jgi:histidine ammonia-lyase
VLAGLLIAARQGLSLRQRQDPALQLTAALQGFHADLCARIALVEEDRALDGELLSLVQAQQQGAWAGMYAGGAA